MISIITMVVWTLLALLTPSIVLAHSNAPDCNLQSDCDDYLDACCGIADPTSRGRGDAHHICWSKYSTRYLDEEGIYYTFSCM